MESLLTSWAMNKGITASNPSGQIWLQQLKEAQAAAGSFTVSLTVHSLLLVSAGVVCFSELFFIKEPHDVTVMRRDAVVLDCQAHGEAPIGIRWLKNGVVLTESERVYLLTNGSLFISEVESRKDKSDEGFYQCLAQNKYGSILSQKARLTIASKLLWHICPFMYVPVLLKCSVNVQWHQRGNRHVTLPVWSCRLPVITLDSAKRPF